MNKSMAAKLTQLSVRLEELNRLLSSETITANLDKYRKLTRERAEIAPVVELYDAYLQSERDIHTAQEMSDELRDAEMREFAEAEMRDAREKHGAISERNCRSSCFPRIPTMSATFFWKFALAQAGTSRRCLRAICSVCMHALPSASAGRSKSFRRALPKPAAIRKSSPRSSGHGAYSKLKFESGGHRVQRVPATETQGRIHTSACTVAVMPEADEIMDVVLNPGRIKDRYIPCLRRRRSAHQQDGFRGAHHPLAYQHRGRVPGWALAA